MSMHKQDVLLPEPVNPGANKTIVVYDETAAASVNSSLKAVPISSRSTKRAKVFLFADVVVTVNVYGKSAGGQFRLIATQASTASTALTKEFPFYGDAVKIELVTTTLATVWEVSIRISDDQAALT